MSKKKKDERRQAMEIQKKIEDIAKRRSFNRGNLMLLISIIWLLGLFLMVVKYGKPW